MKALLGIIAAIMLCVPVLAEDEFPDHFVAAGASWNQYASPQVAGNLLYAKRIAKGGTYSFTHVDIISKDSEQFVVAPIISTGLARHVYKFGNARIFATTTVGVAAGGENVGYSWTAGGAASISLGKGWQLLPTVRVLKTSLSDFQAIVGLMIGFGK